MKICKLVGLSIGSRNFFILFSSCTSSSRSLGDFIFVTMGREFLSWQ